MSFEYIEVTVSLLKKVHGRVRFLMGEGNEQHYLHRAGVLSKPYLPLNAIKTDICYLISTIKATSERLINTYIPVFT